MADGFRAIMVSKEHVFGGGDEFDFLPDLRRDNALFVTADRDFVDRVRKERPKHSGLVLLNARWETLAIRPGARARPAASPRRAARW